MYTNLYRMITMTVTVMCLHATYVYCHERRMDLSIISQYRGKYFLIATKLSYSSQFFKDTDMSKKCKERLRWRVCHTASYFGVPLFEFNPEKILCLSHLFLSLFMTIHIIYVRPTAIIFSHPQGTYIFEVVSSFLQLRMNVGILHFLST